MSAPVREFTAGSAMFTCHAASTRRRLDGFRARLANATDVQLLAAAYRAETLPGHGMADEVRSIVDHEVEWRRVTRAEFSDWWTASVAGGVS